MRCSPEKPSFLDEPVFVRPETDIQSTYLPCTQPNLIFPCDSQQSARIILGPIIGRVTHKSARILIETNIDTEVTCELVPLLHRKSPPQSVPKTNNNDKEPFDENRQKPALFDSQPESVQLSAKLQGSRPHAFHFITLLPCTKYSVKFSIPLEGILLSSFTTLRDPSERLEFQPLRVAFISTQSHPYENIEIELSNTVHCLNAMDFSKDTKLWKEFASRVNDLDYLVHLGNDIDALAKRRLRLPPLDYLNAQKSLEIQYGGTGTSEASVEERNAWEVANEILSRVSSSQDDGRVLVKSLFKQLYKNAWTETFQRQVLANVPNIFFMNQTEIGLLVQSEAYSIGSSTPNASEKEKRNRLIASCAFEVFNEYAELLQYTKTTDSSQLHAFAPLGIANINFNAIKTFLSDYQWAPDVRASNQWKLFIQALTSNGAFSEVSLLILCLQEPLELFTNADKPTRRILKGRTDGARGDILSAKDQLVEALLHWRDAMPIGYREILLVAPCSNHSSEGGISDFVSTTFKSNVFDFVQGLMQSENKREQISCKWFQSSKPELTEECIALANNPHSKILFPPRNRLRQLVIPCFRKQEPPTPDPKTNITYSVKEVPGSYILRQIRYPMLNNINGFGIVEVGMHYVQRDTTLYKNVRSAQKRSMKGDHTDHVRFSTQLYIGDYGLNNQIKGCKKQRAASCLEFKKIDELLQL